MEVRERDSRERLRHLQLWAWTQCGGGGGLKFIKGHF